MGWAVCIYVVPLTVLPSTSVRLMSPIEKPLNEKFFSRNVYFPFSCAVTEIVDFCAHDKVILVVLGIAA